MSDYEAGDIDIKANAPFPTGALSNFAPHSFTFDGVACRSMEGLLQSFKVADPATQRSLCRLIGAEARTEGRKHDWMTSGTLWWQGRPIDRLSPEYQQLLDKAFRALFDQSQKFRNALAATGSARLTHRVGKTDPCDTILTAEELCERLTRLRSLLAPGNR